MKIIQGTILNIKTKQDKNNQNYLILELENQKSIFVFVNQVNSEQWNDLQIGKEYRFTIKEGKNNSNILTVYEELEKEFKLSPAQEYINQNYPCNCNEKDQYDRLIHQENCFRKNLKELNLRNLNLVGDLDLVNFPSELKIYLTGNPNLEKVKNKPEYAKVIYKNPTEWLNYQYPNKDQVEEVDLSDLDFDQPGELVLVYYPNLKRIKGHSVSKLTEITIRNCSQLKRISISSSGIQTLILDNLPNLNSLYLPSNNLINLDLTTCPNLKIVRCQNNQLTEIKLPQREKLTELYLYNNNLHQDLSFLKDLVDLRELNLRNNRFYGSLEPLKNMNKLKELYIEDTDLDSGLEYLSENTEKFRCWVSEREGAKVKAIYDLFADEKGETEEENGNIKNFSQKLQLLKENWKKLSFNDREMKTWTKLDLRLNESELADYFRQRNYHPNTPNIKELVDKESWRDVHYEFNYLIRKGWEKKFFDKKQTQEWITVGAKVADYEFIKWLRDVKGYGPEWITNYKQNYQTLSERFKKYSLCEECKELNTGEKWCQDCNSKHLQENFPNWTSHNTQIDQFIQKYQLEATDKDKVLEWIPYEQFAVNSEPIGEGGFGKVYKAKWFGGNILYWDAETKQWQRDRDYYFEEEDKKKQNKKDRNYKVVALKSLNNSSENTELLQEITKHKIIDDWFNNIVPCYGLSQDPETGNYVMVMKYMAKGNLREYLKNNKELSFQDKFKKLVNIAQGLKNIHQKNLVHRDFHSGNILNSSNQSFITDLGLCKPAGEVDREDKIYGVLPYVAPEVLRNKGYTRAADIYSFGIVAYELFANVSPYLDRDYDHFLTLDICQGLRPDLEKLKIPQLLKNLIEQCWDADPKNRPNINDLERVLKDWQDKITIKKTGNYHYRKRIISEFYQQYQEIEKEYNQTSQSTAYKTHPTEILTSQRLDFKNLPEPRSSKESSKQFYLKEIEEFDSLRIATEEISNDWTNIHSSFTPELIQNWQENFTYNQTQNWINIGLQPTDYEFAHFLKSIKQLTPEKVLNEYDASSLNQEFQTYQQTAQIIQTPPRNN